MSGRASVETIGVYPTIMQIVATIPAGTHTSGRRRVGATSAPKIAAGR
jgi:hypothetical protein